MLVSQRWKEAVAATPLHGAEGRKSERVEMGSDTNDGIRREESSASVTEVLSVIHSYRNLGSLPTDTLIQAQDIFSDSSGNPGNEFCTVERFST